MITRVFAGNGQDSNGCLKCLINVVLLVTNMP
jgi:hypothetical protein